MTVIEHTNVETPNAAMKQSKVLNPVLIAVVLFALWRIKTRRFWPDQRVKRGRSFRPSSGTGASNGQIVGKSNGEGRGVTCRAAKPKEKK